MGKAGLVGGSSSIKTTHVEERPQGKKRRNAMPAWYFVVVCMFTETLHVPGNLSNGCPNHCKPVTHILDRYAEA